VRAGKQLLPVAYCLYNRSSKQKEPVMKTAEALLSELIEHARPPKGCTIKLMECLDNTFLNWIVIRDNMTDAGRERFDKKILHLCQTDPRVDWSAVNESEDSRRVIIYVEQAHGPRPVDEIARRPERSC
jgi:hypothetical protein